MVRTTGARASLMSPYSQGDCRQDIRTTAVSSHVTCTYSEQNADRLTT